MKTVEKISVAWIVLGVGAISKIAMAQTASDTSTVYSGVAFSVACFVVLVLAGILIRRFSNRRKNDLANDAGLDLMGMRQKNLLTPEEMKMVSAALARRMAEKESRQKQTGTGGLSTATLMHDPEVLRLQELAREKREAERAKQQEQQSAQSVAGAPQQPLGDATPGAEFPGDPIPAEIAGDAAAISDASLDDVVLPPEVQQLADAGILSPDEIRNVKRRLKARQV